MKPTQQHPCPECGSLDNSVDSVKVNKQTTNYRMRCRHCHNRFNATEQSGWLGPDRYYGPTPQMLDLVTLWPKIAVRQAFGIDTNGSHIKTADEYAEARKGESQWM